MKQFLNNLGSLIITICFTITTLHAFTENSIVIDKQNIDTIRVHYYYNNETKMLEPIPADNYAQHNLFSAIEGAESRYIFVYGNNLHASLTAAQQEQVPDFFDAFPVASLLVNNKNIFVQQQKTRQPGAFKPSILTPLLPLMVDSSLNIISQLINLSAQTTGILPVTLGGTNSGTALANNCLMQSSGGQIVEAPALSNGQLFIGSTGVAPVAAALLGTTHQINVANSAGSITLSTPQNIDSTASPTFAAVQFQPSGSGNSVALQAPATMATSYAVTLPSTAPSNAQVLQATSSSATKWAVISDPFILYVATTGNDTTGNGSMNAPYRTLKQAITVANATATAMIPVKISVGPGIFIEDTSAGPLTVNPSHTGGIIAVTGASTKTTIFTSLTTTQTFLYLPISTRVENLTISGITNAPGIAADGSGNGSTFINIVVANSQQGYNFSGGLSTDYYLNGTSAINCGVGAVFNNAIGLLYNSTMFGPPVGSITPTNTGIIVEGQNSRVVSESCSYLYCSLAFQLSQGDATFIGGSFLSSSTSIIANNQATCIINGTTFFANNGTNIIAQGLGTNVQITACNINGISSNGLNQGTGFLITSSAQVKCSVTSLTNLINGIIIGNATDDENTQLLSVGVTIDNISNLHLIQNGLSQLIFADGALNKDLITISNPANVVFNTIDTDNTQATIIGQHADVSQDLILVDIGTTSLPAINYQSNYNGNKGVVYQNPNTGQPTLLGVQAQDSNAQLNAITGANSSAAALQLSSQGGTFGGSANLRGWTLEKTATNALLAGQFYNSDTSGKPAVDQYTSFQFDGFNNILQFPAVTTTNLPTYTVTQLQWAGDTNLYRASAGVLQTDNNFAIQGLTSANSALYVDSNKKVSSSITSATDLAQLAGVTGGNIQTQINSKVSRSGDTMTGTLTLPVGSLANPSLNFNGFSKTGLCMTGNVLNMETMGNPRINIDSNGVVGINAASGSITLTVTGNASINGNLVVTNTLTTNYLTINNTPVYPTDGATKAYVDSTAQGLQVKSPCTALSASNIASLSGTTTIDGVALVAGNRVLLINQSTATQNGIWVIQTGSWTRPTDFATGSSAQAAYAFIQSGTTYGDTAYFCTALNPNAVVDTNNLTFVQFSNISDVNGQNLGSGTGVFAQKSGQTLQFKSLDAGANMSITSNSTDITIDLPTTLNISGKITAGGSLIGTSVSDGTGTLKNGTLNLINLIATGTVTSSNGSAAYPSFNFASSPYTGLSAQLPDTLVVTTSGVNRLQINSYGTISIPAFSTAGVLHNDAYGNISSSLVTNADVSATAAIADTKLNTIQTAGKVANSATTGTNLNNPNTLVVRDNVGNFFANNVCAGLQASAGTATSPSITFTAWPTSGLSSYSSGQLSLISGSGERIQLQAGGNIYIPGFISSNGVVKSTSGILSSAHTTIAVLMFC